jgi:UDP-N-acetylmuramyl pentapeptide phosphotransferase/UDP-N-acetylglucosamine-1-phosphate transferase
MMSLGGLFWGFAGIGLIIFMQILSMQKFAVDAVKKHGVAEVQASRLGGVALVIGSLAGLLIFTSVGYSNSSGVGPFGIDWFNWIAVAGCAILGLNEDLIGDGLHPKLRLLVQFIIFGFIFTFWPFLIPKEIGVIGIDFLLSNSMIAFGCCLVFSIGFLNAVNISDGANGLVSSICVIFFTTIFLETGRLAPLVMLYSSSIFLIFNVISGRLFLGDAGSYAIGASLLIGSLYFYGFGLMSLSFLAVTLFYPCVECLVSVLRRFIYRRPIMSPDNHHLHNMLHARYRELFSSKNLANSLSGLTIAGCSSGIAMIGYLVDPLSITSNNWGWVFLFQLFLYSFAYSHLREAQGPSGVV